MLQGLCANFFLAASEKLTDWRTVAFPFHENIYHSVMFDSANGWVIGGSISDSRLYRLRNGIWELAPKPDHTCIERIFAVSPDDIWFTVYDQINYRYFLRHQNQGRITDFFTPNADPIIQMDFLSPTNIWVVCQWGEIMHFAGDQWKLVPCPTFKHVTGIAMANDSCGWASGEYRGSGFLLFWNGREWHTKFQQKDFTPQVVLVNDSLGWGLVTNDSMVIKLNRARWERLPLASLIQDTIFTTWRVADRFKFCSNQGTVTSDPDFTYLTHANRPRDYLWFPSSGGKPQPDIYLFASDGSVKYVRRELPETPKRSRQFTRNVFHGFIEEFGVAMGDIDCDGDDDIFSINTSDKNHLILSQGNQKTITKYRHNYIDVAEHLNLLGLARSKDGEAIYDMGVTFADFDNDGDRDIYVTSMYENNILYENIENRTFQDVAAAAGVSVDRMRSQVGIWGDVDQDGDLDLFVTNEDTTNLLFLNNGFGKFQEVTRPAGLTTHRSGKGATFGDLDLDGDLDLVVPCFGVRNRIYRNEGIQPGTKIPFFREMNTDWLPSEPDSLAKSTAAVLADFDNDGDPDLYISNLASTNRLYENDGAGHFTDITESTGLLDSSHTSSACFFDADNDGDLDLFLSNRGPNLFFKNSNKRFVRDSKTFDLAGVCYSNGVACGDPDRDGDLDLYVANNDAGSVLYVNRIYSQNFLAITLTGTTSNRDAIGAKAFLYPAGRLNQPGSLLGMREVNGGYGYGCMNSTTIHFGVNTSCDLKIWFPSGIEITRTNLAPGQWLIIEEQTGRAKIVAAIKQVILRQAKSRRNQIEYFKFVVLLVGFSVASLILYQKKWIAVRSPIYLPIYPLAIYLIVLSVTYEMNFGSAQLLPIFLALSLFVGLVWLARQHDVRIQRERLAEELLVSCKAFDHGSWATSYLNQLQLFSVNLPAGQPIPEKIGEHLRETIMGFYEVVYNEVNRIQQLAVDAVLQVPQANELGRQVLFLSENLNQIKVALALKQRVPIEVWQNVHRLVDQIKMNVREINYGVTRLFTCDALVILQKACSVFETETGLPVIFPTPETSSQPLQACIKPGELHVIWDNLLQNARQAMNGQASPKISLHFRPTDRHLFIEFSDNGCGIPKKHWEDIFEESFSTKTNGNGGFGLFYSRRVLEKYGGSIEVTRSSRKYGTTFCVKLRRA
jgi:signal transduction histidine kinase